MYDVNLLAATSVTPQSFFNVVYFAIGLLAGVVLHEYAHAAVAVRLGDHTPKLHGRHTLNPKRHVDPFGTIILPGILLLPVLFGSQVFLPFAYAKPQRVNAWSLRKPERDPVLIALAGPAANVLFAFVVGALFRLVLPSAGESPGQIAYFLAAVLESTVVLAVINLIPIPPLDGARIITRFLPPRAREVFVSMEQYAALFILLIFFIIPGPISAFVRVIGNGICGLVAGGSCIP